MAITGKPFQEYVTRQIDLRQESLGEGFGNLTDANPSRKLKTLNVYNSSTPFMRLSSAVSITKGDESLPGTSVYEQLKNSGIGDGIGGVNTWHHHNLAENFVLQGAPNNISGSSSPSGVNLPGNKNVAYGWGYGASQINSQEGYVPPPGVTKVDFDYKGDGALAFATISIKAFSSAQFTLIDILYMRPGYTCLLEFGHSMYYKNTKSNPDPELVSLDTSNTAPFEYLFRDRKKSKSNTIPSNLIDPNTGSPYPESIPDNVTYQGMSKTIQSEKLKHDGNYEAFFGRISKFSWKFNVDGSYDITVKLMGLGDVISSLKTNIPKLTKNPITFKSEFSLTSDPIKYQQLNTDGSSPPTENNKPLIISDAQSTQLNFELFSIFASSESLTLRAKTTSNKRLGFDSTDYRYDATGNNKDVPTMASYDLPLKEIPISGKPRSFTIQNGVVKIVENSKDNKSLYNPATFIKFGCFLAMLQKVCNVTDGESNTLLQFEMVEDIWLPSLQLLLDDTFLVTYPGNFSSNPNKCLIKYSNYDPLVVPSHNVPDNKSVNNVLSRTYDEGADNTLSKLANPSLAMRLSDVYININFIAEVMANLRGVDKEADNEVDISLIDLLKGILSGVNTSLGGLNNFRIISSEVTSQIQIISESPILNQKDDIEDNNTKRATINTLGFNTTNKLLTGGSFVTSMDLNSELTDQMATQISIGAQNNSNTINGNSTTFSSYSKGLIDKLMVKKESTVKATSTSPTGMSFEEWELAKTTGSVDLISSQETIDKIDKVMEASNYEDVFQNVYGDRQFSNNDYVNTLEKITSGVAPLISGAYTQNGNSPPPFFLPFNMSLEMHGLAGMKIFNSFSINGRGLPISYNPSTIQLIIKSLSHTVSLNGWSTKIETLSRPVFNVTATSTVFPQSNNSSITFDESTCEVLMVEGFDTPPSYMGVAISPPYRSSRVRMNSYVRDEIYTLLESQWWVDNFSKGLRMLALATAIKEGYKPGSRSYKTNNPGNIGNTDSGAGNSQPTLQAGLLLLLRYYEKVANGAGGGWGFGHKTIPQYFSEEIQNNAINYQRPNGCLPGYKGDYQGQIGYFVKKYATFARVNNNTISSFSGIFNINGYPADIDGNTLMSDLVAFNPSNTSIKLS